MAVVADRGSEGLQLGQQDRGVRQRGGDLEQSALQGASYRLRQNRFGNALARHRPAFLLPSHQAPGRRESARRRIRAEATISSVASFTVGMRTPMAGTETILIYDGDCPFCSNYVRLM